MGYRERYARIAGAYDLLEIPLDRYFQPLRRRALSFAEGKVLEIGIGTGKTLEFYPEGVELYAIDGTDRILRIAGRRAERLGIDAKLYQMEAENLRFPSESFDTVVSSFVFCTIPNPVKAMAEIRRVLKPGGKAIFLEHTKSNSRFLNRFFLKPAKLFLWPLIGDDTLRETHELVRDFFEIGLEENYYRGLVRLIIARKVT